MLSLKIDNQFIALPDETEISIEASNPIFSDAGAKTYLFEIPVESLRYIIGNADEIYGESLYDVLEGKRAEIYIDGVQFFSGVVNLEDEISIEDGKIAVSIASGNLEFAQMIEGMNCRDVELKDEIEWGYICDSHFVKVGIDKKPGRDYDGMSDDEIAKWEKTVTLDFPYGLVEVTKGNISSPYPVEKFCSIRRCYSAPNKDYNTRYIDNKEYISVKQDLVSLEYMCYGTGPCFYVLYFIDCLAAKLGLSIQQNDLLQIEDAKRLAFVNTGCKVVAGEMVENRTFGIPLELTSFNVDSIYRIIDAGLISHKAILTSENFPDKSVSDVIEAISSLFNVAFLFDKEYRTLSIKLKSDIIKDHSTNRIDGDVFDASKIENPVIGFRLAYSSTEEDDTNYNFNEYSDVELMSSYGSVLNKSEVLARKTYIDKRTGNAYVVKVDEEAEENGDEKELKPSLFEVGAFSPAIYGDCSDDNKIENIELNFIPIINNDINAKDNIAKAKDNPTNIHIDSDIENIYALLLEEDIEEPAWVNFSTKEALIHYVEWQEWVNTGEVGEGYYDTYYIWNPSVEISYKFLNFLGELSYSSDSQVNSYNTDLMLGIMRGPGSDSEPETFAQDFDGEGNYRVAFTAANYAFTSDSIDNCNRDFDYNGTGYDVGLDDLKGRFSLKLRAGKYDKDGNLIAALKDADGNSILDADRENRGIYDTFWKEYAYFTVNKKIVRLTCGMEMADIVNLDWTKRYRIGEWTGFIANYSFNVNKNGMSEVELELYYI